jgi:hypothetical protein
MSIFLIFALLITYVHSPNNSFSKIKLSKGADFPVMGISHKHAPEGSPFVMELILNSPKYGRFTCLYDDEDHEKINSLRWWLRVTPNTIYARAYISKRKVVDFHAFIMGENWIDHINGNGLDNRKINLRKATRSQNRQNSKARRDSQSGFRCVLKRVSRGNVYYRTQITTKEGVFRGGTSTNVYTAAVMANELMTKYFGEFARPNVLTEDELKMADTGIRKYITKNKTSKYRGVFWYKEPQKFIAVLYLENNKPVYLGQFDNEDDAALAYNNGIIEHNRPLKYLNTIPS